MRVVYEGEGKGMNIKTAHCLFEQSGTFKNEFLKLGVEACDYDILNNYGETDYQVDLFDEIERAYGGVKAYLTELVKMISC